MARKVSYEALLDDGPFRRTLLRMQAAADKLPGPFGKVAASIASTPALLSAATAAVTTLTAGIGKALASFIQFEHAIARVATTTGTSFAQVEAQYASLVQGIAQQTGVATDEIAAGVQKAISGGVRDVAEVTNLITQAARFQAAGFGSLAQAVSSTTTVYANFAAQGYDTLELLDAITIAAQQGEGEVSDFSPAFKRLSGTAKLLNIDLADMGAIIANISQTAPSVSEGVVQIEGALKLLIKPSQQAQQALKELGTSASELRNTLVTEGFAAFIEEVQRLVSVGGVELAGDLFRDFQGILALQNLSPSVIRRISANIEFGMGSAIDTAFDDIQETTQQRINELGQAWETGFQVIGQGVATAFATSFLVEATSGALNVAFQAVIAQMRLAIPGFADALDAQLVATVEAALASQAEQNLIEFSVGLVPEDATLGDLETRLAAANAEIDLFNNAIAGLQESYIAAGKNAENLSDIDKEYLANLQQGLRVQEALAAALDVRAQKLRPVKLESEGITEEILKWSDAGQDYDDFIEAVDAHANTFFDNLQRRQDEQTEAVLNHYALREEADRAAEEIALRNEQRLLDVQYLQRATFEEMFFAVTRLRDNTEGWLNLFLNDLPRIISLFAQLEQTAGAGGQGGFGGFLRGVFGFGGRRQHGGPICRWAGVSGRRGRAGVAGVGA